MPLDFLMILKPDNKEPMKRTKDTLTHRARRYGSAALAFTLIELLIVIALTGLLLALLLGPLVQAFGLTNRARALAEAQDATRFGMERLKRELSQAAYVFDNTNMPIVLPIGPAELDNSIAADDRRDVGIYPVQNGVSTPRPLMLYAKVDFRPVATEGEGAGTVLDPTTDKPLGGTRVALPGAPGQRIVRYFIGLSDNMPRRDNGGNLTESEDQYRKRVYYRNVYEFPRWDSDLNPFILYRVEFDPTDPNLVDQTQANAFGPGGLHDPNFFYNFGEASSVRARDNRAGNGLTYAENWRRIANPILSTKNLDVLAWRRGSDRQIVQGNPFQLQISFSPSTVAGDAATPGFLSNTQAEAPGAVPTLYSTKMSQWVYPFTVAFLRGGTEFGPTRAGEPFGQIRFVFEKVDVNGFTQLQVRLESAQGTLQTAQDNYYWLLDNITQKVHVFTPNLAFTVDAARGRIETAFPALATQNNIPLFMPPGARVPSAMQPGPVGNFGQLVPTALVQNTRDDSQTDELPYGEAPRSAGMAYGPTGAEFVVPNNQGIIRAELFDRPNGAFRYYPITDFPPTGTGFASPFNVFGDTNANPNTFRGIMVVPGSEMVMGPDNLLTMDTPRNPGDPAKLLLVTYYRIPAAVGTLAKRAIVNGTGTDALYAWAGQSNYRLETDLGNYNAPYLQFDQPPNSIVDENDPNAPARPSTKLDNSPGLPAVPAGGNGGPQGLLRVTYLWQNNYARNPLGQPINAQGQPTTNSMGGIADRNRVRPEADVVKVDYATRSLMNVAVGARVYDTSAKVPQSAQATDKITVNNVNR